MKKLVVNGWLVRGFIGEKPLEEFTREELNIYFEKALDKAFLKIGYVPVEEEKSE